MARKLIDELLDDLINTNYFYEINKLHYLKGKAMIADGKIDKGKKLAQQAIDTMYQLKNDSLVCFASHLYIRLQRKIHNVATQLFSFYSVFDKACFKR